MTREPDLLPAILARRSPRAFASRPVGDARLAALFDAARWAPSAGNGQPWRFVVTRRGGEGHARLIETLRPGNAAWAPRAPVLVAAACKAVHDDPGKPVRPHRLALLDLGLALENLLLQAAHDGLIAHPMAGFDAGRAAEALAVPDDVTLAVLIAIGHPGDPADLPEAVRAKDARPRTRRPMAEVVFEDRFGAAAPFAAGVDAAGRDGAVGDVASEDGAGERAAGDGAQRDDAGRDDG